MVNFWLDCLKYIFIPDSKINYSQQGSFDGGGGEFVATSWEIG